jgi:hypothetical protein
LGPCSCAPQFEAQVQLYAHPDAVLVTCRGCGERFYVADRRRWMLKQSMRVLVTAEEAARALPGLLGLNVTPALLRELHRRHGLERQRPARTDPHQRARYRVGDIVEVLTERAVGAQRRASGRRAARPNEEHVPEAMRALFGQVRAQARRAEMEKRGRPPVQSG